MDGTQMPFYQAAFAFKPPTCSMLNQVMESVVKMISIDSIIPDCHDKRTNPFITILTTLKWTYNPTSIFACCLN